MRSVFLWVGTLILVGAAGNPAWAKKAAKNSEAAPNSALLGARYTSKQKGFSINLPKGWELKENVMGSAVIAVIPGPANAADFRENINVVVEPLPQAMNTKTYFNESMKVLKKLFTDFKLEKSGHGPLERQVANDKTDAYWSVFTHRMGKVRAKVLQFMAVRGNQAFVITCSASPESFTRLRPTFEATAKTFHID